MIFKRKVKLEEKIREIVKEELEKALAERTKKLAEIDNELWNLKSALNSAKEAIKRIRAIPIKPPYAYTPEYLIFHSQKWKVLVDTALNLYSVEEGLPKGYGMLCYSFKDWAIEIKRTDSTQTLKPREKYWMLIGGFKNKGCTGKYLITNVGKELATFYIRKDEPALILAEPFGTKSGYTVQIEKLEGDPPNFEPIGAIIVPY